MKDSLLVFGGGILQLSIINKAKELGYLTVVIDPDTKAFSKKNADVFIEVKGDDFQKTMDIAIKYNVKGIITSATDHPILMMCNIASELNLSFPSFSSCETLLNKGKFKTFLKENNLPHAKGYVSFMGDIINEKDFIFPVIIKPTINSGSRGVIKCDDYINLQNSIHETLTFSKDNSFIIEEFIEGDEISVEAIVFKNKVNIIQITDKIVTPPPYNVELGHIQPSKYFTKFEKIETLLQKIVDLTGLNNCAIHPELKIYKDKITIIEIGPRLGGDCITSKLVPLSTGINIEELVINMAVNKNLSYKIDNKASFISYLNFPVNKVVKGTISELELIKVFPEVIEFNHNLLIGETIKPITNSLNRYGYYIAQSDNVELIKKISNKINDYIIKRFLN